MCFLKCFIYRVIVVIITSLGGNSLRLSWSLSLFRHLNFLCVSLRSSLCNELWVVEGGPPRFNTRPDSFLEGFLDQIALIILCVGAGIPTAIVGHSDLRELLISDAIVTS